jgi:hypothetical protein
MQSRVAHCMRNTTGLTLASAMLSVNFFTPFILWGCFCHLSLCDEALSGYHGGSVAPTFLIVSRRHVQPIVVVSE